MRVFSFITNFINYYFSKLNILYIVNIFNLLIIVIVLNIYCTFDFY